MRHKFSLKVGDWSKDGHELSETFHAFASAPIEDVRAAYNQARRKLPQDIWPDTVCSEYGEQRPSSKQLRAMEELGAPDFINDYSERPLWMARYVVWFINQGNPSLKVRLAKTKDVPPLQVGGRGKSRIGNIGYGFFNPYLAKAPARCASSAGTSCSSANVAPRERTTQLGIVSSTRPAGTRPSTTWRRRCVR